ncbi:hypothetical protein SAMN04488688_102159 [Paenibacillus sp. cl141a]|nr:hypothetical protein SAMN04488688_102159 [Paenibacillus sp. cl141a]
MFNQNHSENLLGNILSEIIALRMNERTRLVKLYMNYCPIYGKLKLHHIFRRNLMYPSYYFQMFLLKL